MDLKETLANLNNSLSTSYDQNMERALDQLGLQRQQSASDMILPALGIFGAGIAVGASLGLLFAPKRGEELRSDLAHRLEDLRRKSAEEYDELREKSEQALEAARESISRQEKSEKASASGGNGSSARRAEG